MRCLLCLYRVSHAGVVHLPAGTGICTEWALDQRSVPIHRMTTKKPRAAQSFQHLLTLRGKSPHPPRIHLGSSRKQICAQWSYRERLAPVSPHSQLAAGRPKRPFNSQRLLCLSQKKQRNKKSTVFASFS